MRAVSEDEQRHSYLWRIFYRLASPRASNKHPSHAAAESLSGCVWINGGMMEEKQNRFESGIQNVNTESTALCNPSAATISLRSAPAGSCSGSLRTLLIFGCKRVNNTSVAPYLLNFILHIWTHAAAYISHRRLPKPSCWVVCQTRKPPESRSELFYSLHSINVQGSVFLASEQGRLYRSSSSVSSPVTHRLR